MGDRVRGGLESCDAAGPRAATSIIRLLLYAAAASLPLPPELIRRGLYKPAAMAAVLVKLALLCSKVGSAFSPVDIESVVGLLGATAKTQWW